MWVWRSTKKQQHQKNRNKKEQNKRNKEAKNEESILLGIVSINLELFIEGGVKKKRPNVVANT